MYYAENSDGSKKTCATTLKKCLEEALQNKFHFVSKLGEGYRIFVSDQNIFPSGYCSVMGLTKHEIVVYKKFAKEYELNWNP